MSAFVILVKVTPAGAHELLDAYRVGELGDAISDFLTLLGSDLTSDYALVCVAPGRYQILANRATAHELAGLPPLSPGDASPLLH